MEPFDLDRLRKNWERAEEPPRASSARRGNASEGAPRSPYVEARALLRRVRELAIARHGAHRDALLPFLDRADAMVEAMAAAADAPAAPAEGVAPAEGAAPKDTAVLREELLGVVVDLEDLFEVFGACARS